MNKRRIFVIRNFFDDLELIFDTFTSSRKYKNLQKNNNVSFVIGWDDNITVQYEGIAQEVKGEEAEKYKQIYWEKNPEAKRWASKEGIVARNKSHAFWSSS